MTNQFQVHFSDEDLTIINGDYCKMPSSIQPTPEVGQFVVKPQGVYEIATVQLGFDGWDVYLRQIVTECIEGDVIIVYNKDRIYRCEHHENGGVVFKKVTLLTLYNLLQQLEKQMSVKMADLAGHVDDLIA